ncbi:hypothetical protein ACFZB9_12640 [Kitasatospora sp. NPDC008050]|uniref:hypothetical protein n=1 Tax=Kitasatospora sp. NPDC008050 TaxID=3364021 RepID=UPI0036E4C55A
MSSHHGTGHGTTHTTTHTTTTHSTTTHHVVHHVTVVHRSYYYRSTHGGGLGLTLFVLLALIALVVWLVVRRARA